MDVRVYFLAAVSILLLNSNGFSTEIPINPTEGDDADLIQTTLDGLQDGDTLLLSGDFVIAKTIYLPSNFTWILKGSLTLAANANLDEAGWVAPGIDATRRTGITEKAGGATNINMSGGTYYGNSANYTESMRFLNFVRVTNSKFHDMHITEVTDDNFTLGPGSNNNECRNLIGSFAGGNALTDKGDHNKWYDCIAEDCASDGWTPKCRNSEFYRCIARRNEGPGFGMFCRIDGSGDPVDLGEAIEGNKFYACESYENNAAGFSFNISNTSGEDGSITNNYIEATCFNNASSGVRFRNKMPNSVVKNNEINLLCYGNRGLSKSGDSSNVAGGLGNDANSEYRVTAITGTIVSYDNGGADVNTDKAFDCSITVYRPLGENPPILKKGDASNNITVIDFSCSEAPDVWCVREYCRNKSLRPADPSNLVAVADSPGQISLSWTDNASNEQGYRIERKSTGDYAVIGAVGPDISNFMDTGLVEAMTYLYRVQAFNNAGKSAYSNASSATTGVTTGIFSPESSSDLNLRCSNYPNPFNLETSIRYEITKESEISLAIYNLKGQKIRTLLNNENKMPGSYSVIWNATNDTGLCSPYGMYIYVIRSVNEDGGFIDANKMNFIK